MTNPSDIQSLVEARLRQFAVFAGVRIILEREGDIGAKIATALKTSGGDFRPGTAILIGTAASSLRQVQAARLVIEPLRVEITAFENALFNTPPAGSGLRAGDLAIQAAAALTGWTPEGALRPLAPEGVIAEGADGKGGAAASVTLATAAEIPVLRLPGEYGYTTS